MSQSKLIVRTATQADVNRLLCLIHSSYRGEESRKGWTTEADLLVSNRIDEAGMLAKIIDPSGVMLVATSEVSEGVPVACCELRILDQNDGMGFLGLLAVDPLRQGLGLGKQILRIAEGYARETLGMKRLELQVIGIRMELIAWYLRRGYKRSGERPFPYEHLVGGAKALRDDLYFEVLVKDLETGG